MSDTVTVKRTDLQKLIEAGDSLAQKLRSAPGLDLMRSSYLKKWRGAVETVKHG